MRGLIIGIGALLACGGNGSGAVATIEVGADELLLTGVGDGHLLNVTARDASGAVVAVDLEWTVDDPSVVRVDAPRSAVALSEVGSTYVRASVGEVTSDPILVYVARLADGALVFDDDQVLSGPEGLGDPEAVIGVRHRVTLADVSLPAVGTPIVGRETARVLGRITSASVSGSGAAIEYDTVPVPEVFVDLDIDLAGPLVEQEPAGSSTEALEFSLGPFECETDGTEIRTGIGLDVDRTLDFRAPIRVVGGEVVSAALDIQGSITATLSAGLGIPDPLTAKVTCTLTLANIPIPVAGPFSKLLSPFVPIGGGFELDGFLRGTEVTIGVSGSVTVDVRVGFEYDQERGLQPYKDIMADSEAGLDFTIPDPLMIEAGANASFYAFAGLSAGVPAFPTLSLSLIEARAGIRQSFEFGLPPNVLADPALAGGYDLRGFGRIGAGSSINKAIEVLGLEGSLDPTFEGTFVIDESPRGTFEFDANTVAVDESIIGTVTLTSGSEDYFEIYNVDQIRIYEQVEDGPWIWLDTIVAEEGQNAFNWVYTPVAEDVGTHRFAAMAVSNLIPLIPFEVAPNSVIPVVVTDENIDTDPVDVLCAGGTYTCTIRPETGRVYCWGSAGNLGVPGLTGWVRTPVEVPVPGAVSLACSNAYTCAATESGDVYCWGGQDREHLIAGVSSIPLPTRIMGLSGVVLIAAGGNFTCAVQTSGMMQCWGWNTFGQLGSGESPMDTREPDMVADTTLVPVMGISSAFDAAGGFEHACALRSAGRVACWGRNDYGQLGDGTMGANYPGGCGDEGPMPACAGACTSFCRLRPEFFDMGCACDHYSNTPVDVLGITAAELLSAGTQFTCAAAFGGVSCWGRNDRGQLGDGTTDASPRSVEVLDVGAVIDLDTHIRTTCAVDEAGDVVCWGSNERRMFGFGAGTDEVGPHYVTGVEGALQVAIGGLHACAYLDTGEVHCWGDTQDVLGRGTGPATSSGIPAPVVFP